MFLDAVTYPFRKGGWAMILTGAIFSLVLDFASYVPVAGLAVAAFAAGFFAGFYFDIVSTTMVGEDRVPDWPSITELLDDIAMPLLRMIGLVVISFGPLLGLAIWLTWSMQEDEPAFWWTLGGSLAVGAFYFPMAVLGSLAYGNLFGALPHVVLPAMVRAAVRIVAGLLTWCPFPDYPPDSMSTARAVTKVGTLFFVAATTWTAANPLTIDGEQRPVRMLAEEVTISVGSASSLVKGIYRFQQQPDDYPQEQDKHVLIYVPVYLPLGHGRSAPEPVLKVGGKSIPSRVWDDLTLGDDPSGGFPEAPRAFISKPTNTLCRSIL